MNGLNIHGCCRLREIGRDEWNRYWPRVSQANLLQSWEYGDAKAAAEGWQPARFLFVSISGEPLALAQVLTRTWPVVGGAARLNRGPLLLDTIMNSLQAVELVCGALRALRAESRRRRWWLFYAAPELDTGDANRERLLAMGFRFRSRLSPWASARLSLLLYEDALIANLHSKWRNLLRKAQKSGMTLQRRDGETGELETLVTRYSEIQREKAFSGVSEPLLRALAGQTGPDWRFSLYLAGVDGSSSVGMLVSVIHGDTATYLIGFTNDAGRRNNANYLMLWQAILDAKRTGCRWFDLGGLNENTPAGVAHFKQGVTKEKYKLVGEYW